MGTQIILTLALALSQITSPQFAISVKERASLAYSRPVSLSDSVTSLGRMNGVQWHLHDKRLPNAVLYLRMNQHLVGCVNAIRKH